MAKSQENSITILLGLAGYEVGKVIEEEREVVVEVGADLKKPACPRCDSARLYRHGRAKKRRVLHGWSQGRKIYLEIGGSAPFWLTVASTPYRIAVWR